ncbi:unnamed protein product [Durusdinium trenchii]|uniref:K Homology domain-containing protein n=1 Tax=Durusdinium trenchii TaxID=1381693 RepID=A0ABP0M2Y6_9DINO
MSDDDGEKVQEVHKIDHKYVGLVIGKDGSTIKFFKNQSGASIEIDQTLPPGMPRMVIYRGTKKQVANAVKLVDGLVLRAKEDEKTANAAGFQSLRDRQKRGPEGHGDPTGLDKALEVLKSAEVEKGEKLSRFEKKKEERERGPHGGALLEKRAAEREVPNLGEYLVRSTKPGSDDGKRGRQRDVLPLPLWTDAKEELKSPSSGGAGFLGRCEIRRDSVFPDLDKEEKLWSKLHVPLAKQEKVIVFNEELEPLNLVRDEGWIWPAAEVSKDIRLPTFARAIPRKNPPSDPAGIASCNASTIERKEATTSDEHRQQTLAREAFSDSGWPARPLALEKAGSNGPQAGEGFAPGDEESREGGMVASVRAQYWKGWRSKTPECTIDPQILEEDGSDSQIFSSADKRKKQLAKDQPRFAEDRNLACRSEVVSAMGLDCLPVDSSTHHAANVKEMPERAIKRRETKEDRKAERQKIGKLSNQRVSANTLERYAVALFNLANVVGVAVEMVLNESGLEAVLSQYYVLAAVQYRKPQLRGQLKGPWQLESLIGGQASFNQRDEKAFERRNRKEWNKPKEIEAAPSGSLTGLTSAMRPAWMRPKVEQEEKFQDKCVWSEQKYSRGLLLQAKQKILKMKAYEVPEEMMTMTTGPRPKHRKEKDGDDHEDEEERKERKRKAREAKEAARAEHQPEEAPKEPEAKHEAKPQPSAVTSSYRNLPGDSKEMLKLKKKLREIQKIEDSMAAGESVEPLQAEKLNKKEAYLEELRLFESFVNEGDLET